MKKLIKEWILAPRIYNLLIKIQQKIFNRYDKALFSNTLRNTEERKRCFIVGTGSSIKNQDLTLLKDEIVIGVSGLFNHNNIDIINPKYYVNPPILNSHSKYYDKEKFRLYLNDMDIALKDDTIMFFDIRDRSFISDNNLFINKKINWINYTFWDKSNISNIYLDSMPAIWSVSESAIQVALYLGFDKIYLLGFDHDWFNGLFNYSFDTKKARKHFDETEKEVVEKHGVDSEFQMIRHAQIFNKYKKLFAMKENIYNANADQNSYVDAFPKVKYEELFNK